MTTTNTATVKTKTLAQYKNDAIAKGKKYATSKSNSTIKAIECGHSLNAVFDAIQKMKTKKESFKSWMNDNMAIRETQCRKFRKLADKRDSKWIVTHSGDALSINCEVELVKIDDDKANEIRKWAAENKASQSAILAHIKELTGDGDDDDSLTLDDYIKKAKKFIKDITDLSIVDDDNPKSDEFQAIVDAVSKALDSITKVLVKEKPVKKEEVKA